MEKRVKVLKISIKHSHITELLKRKSGSGLRLPSKKKSDTYLQKIGYG